jgi:hypothetical protein
MNKAGLRALLGYLNLSGGAADPQFQGCANEIFSLLEEGQSEPAAWLALRDALSSELNDLAGRAPGFENADQAAAVLGLVFDQLLPEYRAFHRDLLAHQTDQDLFRPLFIAKACQAVLREGPPWSEADRIVTGAIGRLNDFLGHRPVAVLRTAQKIEPYPHEWVCPIPLYLQGVGAAVGRYHDLVFAALEVLRHTDERILTQAQFDPELLDELVLDPRAYDFDHPANKRPNYHFGQWDPHTIDNAGRYRRFVLQAVTLDALLERLADARGDRPELLAEAAVVLAGTMLMAAGVSGRGPGAHDSGTTLATLVPSIAAYRDEFYRRTVAAISGPQGERLRAEAQALGQPLAGARQDLNRRLARLRAVQLQHVHLAQLFASMGNLEASSRQARIVPVASARMLSETSGRLTVGRLELARGNLAAAAGYLSEVDDLLHRGIQCGAIVDPWNILGFQGQFSLFPAMENSVRDHRVDVLIHLVRETIGLSVRATAEAAAAGNEHSLAQVRERHATFAQWWDRFATLDVSGIESVSGAESVEAADAAVAALVAWRRAGWAAGDIRFWREHVTRFKSPRTFSLVIQTLLAKGDFVASMGLLVAWLSESDNLPLAEQGDSFHRLAEQWLSALLSSERSRSGPANAPVALPGAAQPVGKPAAAPEALAAKFFDYLEANAGDYWDVPRPAWLPTDEDSERQGETSGEVSAVGEDDDDDETSPYNAAYEGMTYLDATDDGVDSAMLENGEPASDYELEFESSRLRSRLAFLRMLAKTRTLAAMHFAAPAASSGGESGGAAIVSGQLAHAARTERGLLALVAALHRYRIPKPSGAASSLVEYDRRRRVKDALLAEAVGTAIESRTALRWMRAIASPDESAGISQSGIASASADPLDEPLSLPILRGVLSGDADLVRHEFESWRAATDQRPILYVPLARGGDPARLIEAQSNKQSLVELLRVLPRLGLMAEACRLIGTAMSMERHRPKGERAVTEFDRLFEAGYRALVESIVDAAAAWPELPTAAAGEAPADAELVECLQSLTDPLLRLWIAHSRNVSLSVLERVADAEQWNTLVKFIERYGQDLFTQAFMNQGRLRAILDQGVEAYLRSQEDEQDADEPLRLIADLGQGISRAAAADQLRVVIEAVVENYAEYKDFNTTTTQSDRGELLHTLLDFLRLKGSYERVSWNIRPVVLVHEVLVRRGRSAAAELWRRALAGRTADVADGHLAQYNKLCQRYHMRLASVVTRLAERFVAPLAVDRVRALVAPAIRELEGGRAGEAFARLEQEIVEFAEQAEGSGLETPGWLAALEQEVAQSMRSDSDRDPLDELLRRLPPVSLSSAEILRQLRDAKSSEGAEGNDEA